MISPKIRIWQRNEKKMIYFPEFEVSSYGIHFQPDDQKSAYAETYDKNEIDVMFAATVLSKDAEVIYIGDILQLGHSKDYFEVFWSHESQSIRLKDIKTGIKYSNRIISFSTCSIVGNIYEDADIFPRQYVK